jgi:short subunit dehydrogenase-like uncharacterized protein
VITLFGATGFTGTKIAQKLDERKILFRIAGRSPAKLAALSAHLASRPEWVVADAAMPSTFPALFNGTRLLINCAGPFTDLGEKVAAYAAVSGVHYIDTTNELGYVYRLSSYADIAKKTGATLVPACAFEVALADCAAGLVAVPNCQVDIVYHLSGVHASRGTRLSALRSLATSWLSFQNRRWTGIAPGANNTRFQLISGKVNAISFPSSESVTIPRHIPVESVTVWMTAGKTASFFAPVLLPLFSRFLRSLPGRLVLWAAGLGRSAPNSQPRLNDAFEILVQTTRPDGIRSINITGVDPYEVTAHIATLAAETINLPGFKGRGILSPAQIFEPRNFFEAAEAWGVRLATDPNGTSQRKQTARIGGRRV